MEFQVIQDKKYYKKRFWQQLIIPFAGSVVVVLPASLIAHSLEVYVMAMLLAVIVFVALLITISLIPKFKKYYAAKSLNSNATLKIDRDGFVLLDSKERPLWTYSLDDISCIRYRIYGIYGDRLADYWKDLLGNPPKNQLVLEGEGINRSIDLHFDSHYQLVQFKKILAQLKHEGVELIGDPILNYHRLKTGTV